MWKKSTGHSMFLIFNPEYFYLTNVSFISCWLVFILDYVKGFKVPRRHKYQADIQIIMKSRHWKISNTPYI